MARPVSDEELQLKKRARRRLIGAIVLVSTVVVVLPMVLDSEPTPVSQDITIRIPSPDSGAFTSKIAPLPESKPAAKAPVQPESAATADTRQVATGEPKPAAAVKETVIAKTAEKPEAAKPPPKAPAPREPVAKAAPAPKPESKPVPKEEATKKAAPAAEGAFVVQVVALSDADKAKQMQQQISAAGLKAYTEVVKTARGDVTRVRVGPFAARDAADKAQQQLKAIGLDGKVIPK